MRTGPGKTTTIRILAMLLGPEGGTARVLGYDVVREAAAVRKVVSLTSQFASVDADLTAEKDLLLLAADLRFAAGAGAEVRGPSGALLMAIADWRGVVGELSGLGRQKLADRIGG
jgi:ABC-2 type transport system ATP-binding protein